MGDFKKNPEKPFEIRIPNKIRKRIAMHERKIAWLEKPYRPVVAQRRGSMWSRFAGRVKKFLK